MFSIATLSALPWGKIVKVLGIVAAVLAILWVPYHYGCTTTATADASKLNQKDLQIAKMQKDAAVAAQAAENKQRQIELADQAVIDKERSNAQAEIAKRDAAVVAANAGTRGLRDAYSAYAASHPRQDAGTAEGSTPAPDVLADVFGRVAEAANRFAAEADAARIAGSACERSYDGVRAGQE